MAKIRQVQLVGGKIREMRKERRLTQSELASRIGVQQSDLSRMEKGEYRVSLDTLFKILAEFDVGIGEFFDEVARTTFTPHDVQLIRDVRVSARAGPAGDRRVHRLQARPLSQDRAGEKGQVTHDFR